VEVQEAVITTLVAVVLVAIEQELGFLYLREQLIRLP
jgi:hypothetical protein